jgi:hypothetical protein
VRRAGLRPRLGGGGHAGGVRLLLELRESGFRTEEDYQENELARPRRGAYIAVTTRGLPVLSYV